LLDLKVCNILYNLKVCKYFAKLRQDNFVEKKKNYNLHFELKLNLRKFDKDLPFHAVFSKREIEIIFLRGGRFDGPPRDISVRARGAKAAARL